MSYQVPEGYPPELEKYAKMLKFGIAEEAVRNKMRKDGLEESMFDDYLNPATAINNNNNNNKNIFDNDSDNNNEENDNDAKNEEKQEFEESNPTNNDTVTTGNQNSNNNNSNNNASHQPISKSERKKIRNINYQTSLMENPKQYGEGSFSQTNFVPNANSELKLDTLQPVPVKKTLLIVNTFVVHTTAFLNKFVATCESKLHKIHTDITRMETTLNILEGKLNSINWLSEAESGKLPNIPNPQEFKEDFKDNVAPPPAAAAPGANNNGNANETSEAESKAVEEPAEDPVKSDPTLIPWFKMLKVGVPEQAVRNKMSGSVSADIIDRVIEIHRASKA